MKPAEKSALYSIGSKQNGAVRNRRGTQPFNADSYSRFKYGDIAISKQYAKDLANHLARNAELRARLLSGDAVFASSAYKAVPTAATSIANELCALLAERGYPITSARIHRANLLEGDYAEKTLEERQEILAKNGLSIDEDEFLKKHVFVVDDIRITGSHEKSLESLLSHIDTLSLHFLYVAEMKPVDGLRDPAIEDRINSYWMNGPERLSALMNQESFKLNARTCKKALSMVNEEGFREFIHGLRRDRLNDLLKGIRADGYHQMPHLKHNYAFLLEIVAEKPVNRLNLLTPVAGIDS